MEGYGHDQHEYDERRPEPESKAQEISDSEFSGILQQEISTSLGRDDDEIQGNRELALDYYLGRRPFKNGAQ